MPVISIEYDDLIELLGTEIELEKLKDIIPEIGADIERVDYTQLDIEFFPNRPDLYSVEGIARALRGYLGLEVGLKKYSLGKSDVKLTVEPSVNDVRPYIVCGLIKDVKMTDYLIQSLMDVQEKLHLTVGRKRAKMAIGVHDFDKVKPPFVYKAVDPESIQFIPLGKSETMDLNEVLRKHEKGVEYAFTLKDFDRYPIILDSNDEVLSFPPIINGILTMVTEDTKNIFLDLTGTDFKAVNYTLNIISTALAERGSKIETVDVVYEDRTIVTPDFTPRKMLLKMDYLNHTLAMSMSTEEAVKHLKRMRFGTNVIEQDMVETIIPAYRTDILHPIDLIEDIAISYGYMKLEPMHPTRVSFADIMEITEFCNKLRTIMTGFGYNEVVSFTLSSEEDQFRKMNLEGSDRVEIKNPITEDHTCVRISLIPNLLSILKLNKRRDLPQKIFEVGVVVKERKNQHRLTGASAHPKASFTEIKAIVEGIISRIGVDYEVKPSSHNSLIDGRRASIAKDEDEIGVFGEVHPEVITNFELFTPIACFELDVDKLNKYSS